MVNFIFIDYRKTENTPSDFSFIIQYYDHQFQLKRCMHLLFILYRVKFYNTKSKNMRKKKGSLWGYPKHETLRTNNSTNIQLIICRKESVQMLVFHNFLFLTLQLIYIEHKYAATTQSSAHKVKHTHHSNTKHRERLRDMGITCILVFLPSIWYIQ